MKSGIPVGRLRMLVYSLFHGLFYCVVLIFSIRQYHLYLVRRTAEEFERLGRYPPNLLYMVNERGLVPLLVVAFVVAGWLVHRSWRRQWTSSIIFWQAIGLSAIVGWQLLRLSLLWLDKVLAGGYSGVTVAGGYGYDVAARPGDLLSLPIMLITVIAANLAFAGVVNLYRTIVSFFFSKKHGVGTDAELTL